MIQATLRDSIITSASHEAFTLHEKSSWGEKKAGTIEYSWIEALTLAQHKKLVLETSKKSLTFNEMLTKAKKQDKRIQIKLAAFADLRKRGYVVKTGLKFGAEFRVYKKGIKPGQDHAPWLLVPVKEHEALTWYDFAGKSRVATSTGKKVLLAIVDESSELSYYEVHWFRP